MPGFGFLLGISSANSISLLQTLSNYLECQPLSSHQRVGNVIAQIAQVNIESAEQAKKIINKSINPNMESILIQIFQDGFPKFAPLKLK